MVTAHRGKTDAVYPAQYPGDCPKCEWYEWIFNPVGCGIREAVCYPPRPNPYPQTYCCTKEEWATNALFCLVRQLTSCKPPL